MVCTIKRNAPLAIYRYTLFKLFLCYARKHVDHASTLSDTVNGRTMVALVLVRKKITCPNVVVRCNA